MASRRIGCTQNRLEGDSKFSSAIEINAFSCKSCFQVYMLVHSRDIVKSSTLSLLESLEQLLRRILAIAPRIVANPLPQISASILKRELSLPFQLRICSRRVGCEIQHITSSSANNLILQIVSDNVLECVDHLKDGAAAARSKVPGSDAGILFSEVVQGGQMALCEVDDVDVVSYRGPVSGRVVCNALAFV